MDRKKWIEKAGEQFRKTGIMYKDDGLLSISASEAMAKEALEKNPDALSQDPVAYAKGDLLNWVERFAGDDKEDE